MSWQMFEQLPSGFFLDKTCGSPKHGYSFATNGSVLTGGKRILVKNLPLQNELFLEPIKEIDELSLLSKSIQKTTNWKYAHVGKDSAKTFNELARKQFEVRMFKDILVDLTVCEIEGWSKTAYIDELKLLINGIKHRSEALRTKEQIAVLHDLFNQINGRLDVIGETPDAYFLCQCVEILKQQGATIDAQATRITELQTELDCYCPRPANGQTDHTSAGCIKRGECGCDIRCRVKEST